MSDVLSLINMEEAKYFYNNPHSLVDYSQMQSFSLIKSCIEVFAYYNAVDFTPEDIKEFFSALSIVQQKNNKVFVPSPKKVSGVFDCCLSGSDCVLSRTESGYHIDSWNSDGYKYEILKAKEMGYL